MSTDKPLALELVDHIALAGQRTPPNRLRSAVSELRRLHAEQTEMRQQLIAARQETADAVARCLAAVQEEREACAVAAWSKGMEAYNQVSGLPCDARNVGSYCAAAIRARKDGNV